MKNYSDNVNHVSKLAIGDPDNMSSEGIEPLRKGSIPRNNFFKKLFLDLAPVFLVITVWEVIARLVMYTKETPFPTPVITFKRLMELLAGTLFLQHTLYSHLVSSLSRWSVGLVFGVIFGITAGMIIGRSRLYERIAMPVVYILQLIPGLAWIPIAILLFGIGEGATIFIIFIIALVPVVINMVTGIRGIDEAYIKTAQMMGAKTRTIFFQVLLPGAAPHLLSGLRIAVGSSWRVLIAAEMVVGSGSGLGYSIIQARWNLDYASSFVCIIAICFIGLVVEKVFFERIELLSVKRWGIVNS